MSADMLDKTNKDTPGIKQYDAGEDGWTLSVEALWDPAATEGFSEALGYLKAGTQVTVLHGIPAGVSWQGFAFISSVDVAGPKNEISSYSMELQGTSTFGTFSAEYQAVYNELTTKPSAAIAGYQNTMVQALVDAGVWVKLDIFYVFAQTVNSDSEALKNWINPGTNDAAAVSGPAFVALEGFTSDGAADYINTNFNPNTEGVQYTQNSASFGIYIRNNVQETKFDCGINDGVGFSQIATRNGSDAAQFRINNVGDGTPPAVTDSRGMWIASRTASNARVLYRNASSILSDSEVSTAIPSLDVYVLALNLSGSPNFYTVRQASMFFMGSGLDQSDVTALTNAFEAYMDANSKGVIT
jgi:hypothetical protein